MRLLLVLFLSVGSGDAWYNVQCSGPLDNPEEAVSVNATTDGVRARYVVRYCTTPSPPPVEWILRMNTLDETPEHCTYSYLQEKHAGKSHSESHEMINSTSVNTSCPYVCFSKVMDLIYETCYRLENQMTRQGPRGTISPEPFNSYHYIDNGIKHYTNVKHAVECYDLTDSDTQVVCNWLEGEIPFTDYEVMLEPNTTNSEGPQPVSRNCTRVGGARGSVRCSLHVGAEARAWLLQLRHLAPWTRGHNHLVQHQHVFLHTPNSVPKLEPVRSSSVAWACGAVAVGAGSLLAGLLAYRQRRAAKIRLKVLQQWLGSKPDAEPVPSAGQRAHGSVLLLYARDCPPAQRVATILSTALQQQGKGQVFDLYSPEVLSVAAPAPHAFVRECVQRPDVRIVLLQTPALAALHTVRAIEPGPKKQEEPLLPRGVMYRAPVFGDQLVQYALQLVGETAPCVANSVLPYRKYHLASISGLEVDILPAVVPYTRYELPAALPALALALWPPAPPAPPAPSGGPAPPTPPTPPLSELAQASAELVDFARDNPHYLEDYLMFVD